MSNVAVLRRPELGWPSLLTLLGMLLVVGLSVADARPLTLGGEGRSDSIVVAMVAAGLIGFLLAGSSLGLVRAHVIGAVAGACFLLLVVAAAVAESGQMLPLDLDTLQRQMADLSARLETEVGLFLGEAEAAPSATTFLVLGAISWTSAQFSAFSVFRHERAGPAIMASGVVLFLNEAMPTLEAGADELGTLPLLAVYSALAMLLLVRMQLVGQSRQWTHRHIADSTEVGRHFLRTGALFVALVVAATTALTTIASVPPQSIDSGSLEEPLDDLRESLSRWLALFAVDVRPQPATNFDDRLVVADTWEQGMGVAFEAEVPGGLRGNYWWASAYADFDGHAWNRNQTSQETVLASEPIPVFPDASGAGPHTVQVSVSPRRSYLALGTVLGPSEPSWVSRDVEVRSLGDGEGLSELNFRDDLARGDTYSMASSVHDYSSEDVELTAWLLRASGSDYPAWMGRYLQVNQGASGPRTAAKAEEIARLASARGLDDPYHEALILQNQLRALDYATSIRGLCQPGENVPECLLRTETGFCQQFASTMVMVLRELEIPARLVNGFLPGTALEADRYEVPMQALHAWVEVYFPDIGWVRFDPTPGEQLRRYQQEPTRFPEGEPPRTDERAGEEPPDEPNGSPEPVIEPSPSPAAGATLSGGDAAGGLDVSSLVGAAAGLAAVVLVVLAVSLFARLRRLPGSDGGLAYERIVSLARRLGHGPLPSQTEYEYAASLGQTLPEVREDLYIVAHARVEKAYARREVPGERRGLLARAYARIRTALLRLTLRSH